MTGRHQAIDPAGLLKRTMRPFGALGKVLQEGYSARDLRADLMAGLVVGVVALPLSMALAIASGVAPQHGLYTAIVAGALIALLGGSRVQVSGPTAAFVVILAPIASQFGLGGLLIATMMAGVILVILGGAGLGQLIQFIPYPVTSGFTAGIAVVIGTLQMKDLLGLNVAHLPEHYLERLRVLLAAVPTLRWTDCAIGCFTLIVLLVWPKVTKRIPSPLVGLLAATIASVLLHAWDSGFQVATIGSRFSYIQGGITYPGIPRLPPLPAFPWSLPGADGGDLDLSFGLIRALIGPAFAIAMLGAIESLLSAVVADGMTGDQHDPNAELIAQGVGNIAAPFFGGIAATGAIARTATNVRYGARSPLAAVFHAAFLLAAILLLAPWLSYLPMAALAALMLVVAWNMSEVKHVFHTLRVAPRSDVAVLLTCFTLTVVFDMVVSVTAGIILASLLFMKRMAEVSTTDLITEAHPAFKPEHASSVVIYEVAGPLFFGAAQKAISTLRTIRKNVKVVVLDLRAVPIMDATGLVSLESAAGKLQAGGIFVVLGGVQPQPLQVLKRAGWDDKPGRLAVRLTLEEALSEARRHLEGIEAGRGAPN